jgi:hypothetical protein
VPLLRFCSEPSSAPSKLECADMVVLESALGLRA